MISLTPWKVDYFLIIDFTADAKIILPSRCLQKYNKNLSLSFSFWIQIEIIDIFQSSMPGIYSLTDMTPFAFFYFLNNLCLLIVENLQTTKGMVYCQKPEIKINYFWNEWQSQLLFCYNKKYIYFWIIIIIMPFLDVKMFVCMFIMVHLVFMREKKLRW